MLRFAKIIDEQTKQCQVGTGTNIKFYQSIGFTELDVEQSDVDNAWYLSGFAPMKSAEQIVQELKVQKIKQAMSEFTSAMSQVTINYTEDEKVSFYKQEDQATYYLAEKAAGREPDPAKIVHISAIASNRGVTLDVIAAKIMAKVPPFEVASGALMGSKQRVEDLVEGASTEEELMAIDPHEIIFGALEELTPQPAPEELEEPVTDGNEQPAPTEEE